MAEGHAKPDKGTVTTDPEECKGCGLCVEACPPKVLQLAEHLNRYGYHPALYIGRRLHRLRHLLLCLPGTRRHHVVAVERKRSATPKEDAMAKQLIKGNEAVVKAAVLAGCRAFYGYPITPASEIAEAAAALSARRWAELSSRPRAKSPPSTWCTAPPQPACAP